MKSDKPLNENIMHLLKLVCHAIEEADKRGYDRKDIDVNGLIEFVHQRNERGQ